MSQRFSIEWKMIKMRGSWPVFRLDHKFIDHAIILTDDGWPKFINCSIETNELYLD